MKFVIYFFSCLSIILSSCGLKYTPTETREDLSSKRKTTIEQYIRDSYKDTSVVYQSLLYGATTVVKPYNHRRLDSLYQIKYDNELRGKYDKELEEKINNQRHVVHSSNEKVSYVEHHVYNIATPENANIYYVDVKMNHLSEVVNFEITENFVLPSTLLASFKSYLTRESIVYPNFAPTNEELQFYDFFEQALTQKSIAEKDSFMTHMLTIFLLARNTRTIDIKLLLQHLSIIQVENRPFSSQVDIFQSVDGIYEGETLIQYEVKFKTPMGSFIAYFTPYFEVIIIEKVNV